MNSTKDGQGREEKQAVQGKKDVLRLFLGPVQIHNRNTIYLKSVHYALINLSHTQFPKCVPMWLNSPFYKHYPCFQKFFYPCSHLKDLFTKLFDLILLLERLSKVCLRSAILIIETTPTLHAGPQVVAKECILPIQRV